MNQPTEQLFKNNRQRIILNATHGIERWQSAIVAGAIVRRIKRIGGVRICKSEVRDIDKMHEVLKTGRVCIQPFQSLATNVDWIYLTAKECGFDDNRN